MSKKFLSPIKLAQGASVPSAGSSGELFYNTTDSKIYTHNGTAWVASGGGVTNSATAPSSPANGDAWFNTTEGTLFIYYADGTSGQWVEATAPKQGVESYQLPAGSIMAWGGSTAPTNWMIADGTAVSRTTYASLFAAIGTQYGVGDGSTTFNLPNLKGRVVAGLDSSQTEFDTLGETGGAKTHTLLVSEMPSHTHIQDSHNHTQNSHNHSQNAHYHQIITRSNVVMQHELNGGSSVHGTRYNSNMANELATASSTATNNATTATNQATTATNQNTGGDGAHNNLQPYIVLNYIIKYSAGETPGDSQLATRVGATEVRSNSTSISKNYIINGAFDIWQRGTSFSSGGYKADRWFASGNGTGIGVWKQMSFTPSDKITENSSGKTYLRYEQTIAGSGQTYVELCAQRIEDVRNLAGQQVTVSFWARSSVSRNIKVDFYQRYDDGGSSVGHNIPAFSISTSWVRYQKSITLTELSASRTPGVNSNVELYIYTQDLMNTAGTVDIWGVQVELGSTASTFKGHTESPAQELLACQRYYWRRNASTAYAQFAHGMQYSTTNVGYLINLPVPMRVFPTSLAGANLEVSDEVVYGVIAYTVTFANYKTDTQCIYINATMSANGSALRPCTLRANASGGGGAAYLAFDAEL